MAGGGGAPSPTPRHFEMGLLAHPVLVEGEGMALPDRLDVDADRATMGDRHECQPPEWLRLNSSSSASRRRGLPRSSTSSSTAAASWPR